MQETENGHSPSRLCYHALEWWCEGEGGNRIYRAYSTVYEEMFEFVVNNTDGMWSLQDSADEVTKLQTHGPFVSAESAIVYCEYLNREAFDVEHFSQ